MTMNGRNIQKVCVAFFSRSTVASLRLSMPLEHDPGLKRKLTPKVNKQKLKSHQQMKDKKARENKAMAIGIVPPIDPDRYPEPAWLDASRKRAPLQLSYTEKEERVQLLKEWSRYAMQKHKEELQKIQERIRSRHDALRELKKVAPNLHQEVMLVDKSIFPLILNGPVETPPIYDYMAPDKALDENELK